MNHLKALALKFVIVSAIVLPALSIASGATFTELIIISLLVTGVSYVLGDLFLLPKLGNLKASLLDFGLMFGKLWIMGIIFFTGDLWGITFLSLLTASFLAMGEAFFHAFMQNKVLKQEDRKPAFKPALSMETAKEEDIHDIKRKTVKQNDNEQP